MSDIGGFTNPFFGPKYELIEKSEDIREIKIIKLTSFKEIIGIFLVGVFMSFIFKYFLNMNSQIFDRKITYIVLVISCVLINIALSTLFRVLRKNSIILKHDSFILDKNIDLFYLTCAVKCKTLCSDP
ncbi:hypothetical protein [Acetivibrio mesophilus]|uniref:Uncharacterized protein n=1 Tax=Acetivibrio mesophilus TaxID=2487273 RepID=A0A4Q0I4Y3_9FIRM|nr:hypothetical protein [Acetivibrio mesophilus]RXE58795.1 hypothetical protein EFD62_10035 [Acetivibrio mesophilus]